jgi:hypothetical protein
MKKEHIFIIKENKIPTCFDLSFMEKKLESSKRLFKNINGQL